MQPLVKRLVLSRTVAKYAFEYQMLNSSLGGLFAVGGLERLTSRMRKLGTRTIFLMQGSV